MSIRDPNTQNAWDALAAVQTHPQVQQWLADSDARAAQRKPPFTAWRTWAAAAGIVLTVGVAGVIGYSQLSHERFETGVGEQRDIVLADGSLMTLNTNTAVSVRYTRSVRLIQLERGEALFTARQDRIRPFEVAAGKTLTRAIGTEFNVDMRQDKVTVSVIDGAVRVSADDEQKIATLAKGQAVEFPATKPLIQTAQADIKRIDAWRTRKLEFSDTPLADAVKEFNRYSKTRIVIGTENLEPVRVSGVFRIGDADGFLYSLREALGVQTHESADEVVLMR